MSSLCVLLSAFIVSSTAVQVDYSQYVNPFIGSEGPFEGLAYGGGDIFVGAAVPFGVVKVGIDTYEENVTYATINGGWTPKGLVTAISMMHEHGTGGPPKYGIVPQMPLASLDGVNVLDNRTYWQRRIGNDTASVGHYATRFENGVEVQLSGTRHCGIMQYDFPGQEKHVLVDVSHYLPVETSGNGNGQFFSGGMMNIHRDGRTYSGYGNYGGGFSGSAPMTTYFCGEFEEAPDQARTFIGRNTDPMVRLHTFANGHVPKPVFDNITAKSGPLNNRVGALFTWSGSNSTSLRSRVGVSMISADKACQYKDNEIPSWRLNDTVDAAVHEWNRDVFAKVRVTTNESANRTNLVLLYSSLYFMHLMPSDRTGENALWESEEPYWDDFYTYWDIFRCSVSFYLLVQPAYYISMLRATIDIWRHEGFMPDGRSGDYSGLVQGGSNADNALADAYVKHLTGINWTDAYQAMLKDAEVVPYNTFNPTDLSNGIQFGRGALSDWIDLGYLSADRSTRSISRSIEYSLNDFSLYQIAKEVAPEDAEKYLNRSAQWQNQWARNVTHKGFTGFMAPRSSNGEFNLTDYNPAKCGDCSWEAITYEGTPFEYSFTVPHDMETLIDFMGGEDEFERRLDYIFQPNTSEEDLGPNGAGVSTIMNIGNEPDFATPYLYNYLNKQYKSVMRSRSIAYEYYNDRSYGVPGNSDAGAINAWLLWNMLGLYPIVTQPVYLLTSPWFSEINMTVSNNKTLRILANNLDNQEGYYVQSVKVNGEKWGRNWLEHADVMLEGGTIEFELGREMVVWETEEVPPSPGHLTN